MITPTRFEIACDAWDCKPDLWNPWSRPLIVEARSAREAARKARELGWSTTSPTTRKYWWCPRHASAVSEIEKRRALRRNAATEPSRSEHGAISI